MKKSISKILWVALFSIAMAYLESAVVVYLRRMYGITDLMLQMPPFDPTIAAIELGRELATLVMLLSIGWIAGNQFQTRISYALISFGLWDIFYYFWLRIFIGWPRNLFEPDLLFLIPLPWWGPVLSPVLIAGLMVAGGIVVIVRNDQGNKVSYPATFWISLVAGVFIMLYSFMEDALKLLPADAAALSSLRPSTFDWPIYLVGFILAGVAFAHLLVKKREKSKS